MSLDKNNKELIEIYKKTIYSIEKDIKYIKLFNIIPLLKIKTKRNISKVYLFNFIPLFKITTK